MHFQNKAKKRSNNSLYHIPYQMQSRLYFFLCLLNLKFFSLSLKRDLDHGDDEQSKFMFNDWVSSQDCAWIMEGGKALHEQRAFCDRVLDGKVLWDECKKICEEMSNKNLQVQSVSTSPLQSVSTSHSLHPINNDLSIRTLQSNSQPSASTSSQHTTDDLSRGPRGESTTIPSNFLTSSPSLSPSQLRFVNPIQSPSLDPSTNPTLNLHLDPSTSSSDFPIQSPSEKPKNDPSANPTQSPTLTPPNLVIIYTDEHNYRTLGSYRKILNKTQAFIWGDDVELETPNIDSIANEGALFTNMFTASPLCTPARASFLSGMYPSPTGAWENKRSLHENVTTFAQVLNDAGWETGYMGKWHLGGPARPGWASSNDNVFGFSSAKYL